MDDKEAAKIAMEVVLRPVTEITENALGLLGGDWLSERRARNRHRLRAETEELLSARKADMDRDPSPTIAVPLLSAAQDESRDELLSLWARLLACALDPDRRQNYRREFVDIAKALEPIDAAVLPLLKAGAEFPTSRREYIAQTLGETPSRVQLAFRNLAKSELVENLSSPTPRVHPSITTLGQQFLLASQP